MLKNRVVSEVELAVLKMAIELTSLRSHAKSREEAQLEEAGQGPYLGFFSNVALPTFLQKPSANGRNSQAQSQRARSGCSRSDL